MEEIDGQKSVGQAISDIRKPLAYSFLTSSIGFLCFYFSPISILKQFSLLGILTLFLAVVITLFILFNVAWLSQL